MNTTNTVKAEQHPKPYGWCQSNGVAHAYEDGPTLTIDPPIQTRICKNCGWRQFKRPSVWSDN